MTNNVNTDNTNNANKGMQTDGSCSTGCGPDDKKMKKGSETGTTGTSTPGASQTGGQSYNQSTTGK